MPNLRTFPATVTVALACVTLALVWPTRAQQPAPGKPYKAIAVVPPADITDADLTILRNKVAEAARDRNRAALARLVVARGFFWERESGDGADKKKPGIDNLSAALGLNNKDGVGWDMLTAYADDPATAPSAMRKGAFCAPAEPRFDRKGLDALLKSSQTDISEWSYPHSAGVEVHATPQANAPVVDKLGLTFVRVMPETKPASAAYLRVLTPAGKTGYVRIDALAPFGNDQLCYVKDADGWKIGGFIGAGEPQ